MDWVQSHLDFLLEHVVAIVFFAFLIEAAGIPFPSRIILLVAATLTTEPRTLATLVAVSAGGALIGDHVPYVAGALTGPRILALYCRLTLGSEQCVEKTVRYFIRFGPAAILLSRFSASVRLFAAALSGCGHIAYSRFLAFDVVGSVLYALLLVTVGRLVGESAAEFLGRLGGLRILLFVGPLAFAGLLGYRLYRRRRYGAAKMDAVRGGAACLDRP
ncbi:MAG TPA: VTT domain-containing protein [Methylomirabilota bacterium]|jgi:membrane protein DedA with SNARE-associated domain